MVNEKCRQRVPAWEFVGDTSDKFSALFARVLNTALYEGCPAGPERWGRTLTRIAAGS